MSWEANQARISARGVRNRHASRIGGDSVTESLSAASCLTSHRTNSRGAAPAGDIVSGICRSCERRMRNRMLKVEARWKLKE